MKTIDEDVVLCEILEIIEDDFLPFRVDQPVLAYTGAFVLQFLDFLVVLPVRWREDFHDEVRGTIDVAVLQH